MNRKQRRAARSSSGGSTPGRVPGQAPTPVLADLFNTAVMHHHAGALAEAERCYRQLLAAFPGHAEAHSRLGAVLIRQGKAADAVAHIERALALKPDLFEACGNLAQAYMWTGQPERAIDAACRAVELKETAQSRALFAQCIAFARFSEDSGRFRRLVLRAIVGGWVRPRDLVAVSISLIKLSKAVKDAVARAEAAWPGRRPADEFWGSSTIAALAQDELLCRLLECDPLTDLGLERLLTNVRGALLQAAAGPAGEEHLLGFCCSLTRQCFINEYVYPATEAEARLARQFRVTLERMLAAGDTPPAHWLAIAAAYFPLHAVANVEFLLTQSWPPAVEALIDQQVREPAEERRLAATIPALTAIDDPISLAVRQQYEENPYPRWTEIAPRAEQAIPKEQQSRAPGNALIAGCGTGLSTIEFARQAGDTHVLAVDLSLASLSYAKRMAQRVGLRNVEFAHADIMKLGSLQRQFDFIDASGVLHHLADPWQGWRILLSLLRPGGTMQVGLYSEIARRNVVAARALIAERGYGPTAEDIQRCREELLRSQQPLLRSIVKMDDFFTTSECRDLLFHVQEHRTTLPAIKSFLTENDLEFGGFLLDLMTHHRFAVRFRQAGAALDLDCWHAFETEAPDTFAGMYQFSLRRRG
jgi:SAM-dependent methyltransferase